ncbi:MAG: hypothetical protein HUJ54_02020 [Erysipelotrichaceae bacterium]|nr:hypothetical protein [Erysipelotrichaceae bacterium]
MKKITALVLSLFLMAGCGGSQTQTTSDKQNTMYVSQEQMETILKSDGWNVQNTTAASFHLWEQLNPTFMILAENLEKQVCIIGAFRTSEVADAAYQSLIPAGNDNVTHENTNLYDQSFVTLGGEDGYWLVRCGGNYVMAGWMSSPDQRTQLEQIFTSFQQDSSQSAVPLDSNKSSGTDASSSTDSKTPQTSDQAGAQTDAAQKTN